MSNKANIKFTQSTTILKIPVDILNAGLTSAVQKKDTPVPNKLHSHKGEHFFMWRSFNHLKNDQNKLRSLLESYKRQL